MSGFTPNMTGFILKVAGCSRIWLDGLHFIFLYLPNGSGTTRSPGLVHKGLKEIGGKEKKTGFATIEFW